METINGSFTSPSIPISGGLCLYPEVLAQNGPIHLDGCVFFFYAELPNVLLKRTPKKATLACCSGTSAKALLGTCSCASRFFCERRFQDGTLCLAGKNMPFKQTRTCLNSINQLLLSLEMRKHLLSR